MATDRTNADAGLAPLPRTEAIIEDGIAAGLHIGAQLYVSFLGQPIADLAIGESRPGVQLMRDTLMLWLSATKPITALAVMQQVERGALSLDEPVAAYLPEFGRHGKHSVTPRHLLTHTAGLAEIDLDPTTADWGEIIAAICESALQPAKVPGEQAAYVPLASWYVLAELVQRADGRKFAQYVRQEIFKPLEMFDCWIGMPAETYQAYGDRIAMLPDMTKTSRGPQRYSLPAGAAATVPGGNGYGPMRQLAALYEMLLARGQRGGHRVLSADSVEQMTTRWRTGMTDATFRHQIDWGLGLIINSNRYGPETVPYGYGRYASEGTFGHGGSRSSIAFADPAHQLVVALAFNGMPTDRKHNTRNREACSAIYRDLGLA